MYVNLMNQLVGTIFVMRVWRSKSVGKALGDNVGILSIAPLRKRACGNSNWRSPFDNAFRQRVIEAKGSHHIS